jgi:hypothetical protein
VQLEVQISNREHGHQQKDNDDNEKVVRLSGRSDENRQVLDCRWMN